MGLSTAACGLPFYRLPFLNKSQGYSRPSNKPQSDNIGTRVLFQASSTAVNTAFGSLISLKAKYVRMINYERGNSFWPHGYCAQGYPGEVHASKSRYTVTIMIPASI